MITRSPRRRRRKRSTTTSRPTKRLRTSAPAPARRHLESTGIATRDLLALAHAVYRSAAWISAKAATGSQKATWEVLYLIHQDVDAFHEFQRAHPSFAIGPEDEAAADELLAWSADRFVATAAAAGLPDDADETYWRSVAEALVDDEVTGGRFVLVCSAIPAFCRRNRVTGDFIGTVGERRVFSRLTLERVTPARNSFRARRRLRKCVAYRLLFRDEVGNGVVWFSSRAPHDIGIELGKPCSLKATVRKHVDFKGDKHTQITRGMAVESLSC